jgi:hypothetical protein
MTFGDGARHGVCQGGTNYDFVDSGAANAR